MTTNLWAQVDTTYAARMNYIFKHIDKTKIPFGLLKDAALETTELGNYNGTVLVDSTLVYYRNWDDVYLTLATAQIHPNASATLPNPNWVDSLWFAKRQPGQVTLAGLYYKYSRYADDAASKVTVVNDQVYDKYVNGIWQNPYKIEQVMAFSPANTEYPALGFSLYLPPELWLSNQKNQVAAIECDASDGLGYRVLKAGVSFPVLYAESGIKVLHFKIILSDNTILQSRSVLHVSNSPYAYIPNTIVPGTSVKGNGPANVLPPGNCISGNVDANGLEKILMTSTESYNGKQAKGLITVKYAQADHQIHKPLIVVEGFDPGVYTKPEDLVGDYGLESFKKELSNSSNLTNILLDFPQYDIIYIDWKDGTEDLRLNALLLKTVIRCVNQVKVDPAVKNVVLGQSMGGVIARYALKKMEDEGENHDTRLFISHDAPQQGANVPLGLQAMMVHAQNYGLKSQLSGVIAYAIAGSQANLLLINYRPAAKQLLSHRLNIDYQPDDVVYSQWQAELKNLGYPQTCRNIAISNGSECGTPQPLGSGENLFLLDGYYKTTVLGDVLGMFAFPLVGMLLQDHKIASLGMIPGSNKFTLHFEVNALPNFGGSSTAYTGKMVYKKKILWLVPITTTLMSKVYAAPAGLNSLDQFPGGFFVMPIESKIIHESGALGSVLLTLSVKPFFSFIPTPSALDIGSGNVALGQVDYYSGYVGAYPPPAPKNTPFANFTTAFSNGSSVNEEHISFTQRNGNWLAQELNANIPVSNCAAFCNLTISGFDCMPISGTYSLPNAGLNSVQWWVTGKAFIPGPSNTSQITLVGNGMGKATLHAQLTSDCGTFNLQKDIFVGSNQPQIVLTGKDYNGTNTHYFKITNLVPDYSYKWYLNNNFIGNSGPNYDGFQYQMPCYGSNYIYAQIQTNCSFQTTSNTLYIDNCSYVVVYPNPANTELTISFPGSNEAENAVPSDASFEVKLYNSSGKCILTKQSALNQLSMSISTQKLPNGVYFLHILSGGQVEKKKILIQH
ncbi:MAG: T9SS type A sorting domain-containing protein [Sphingobacteriaceae bacterium]